MKDVSLASCFDAYTGELDLLCYALYTQSMEKKNAQVFNELLDETEEEIPTEELEELEEPKSKKRRTRRCNKMMFGSGLQRYLILSACLFLEFFENFDL